jgi:hypothetical protein
MLGPFIVGEQSMTPAEIAKYISTAKFIAGAIAGALGSAGVFGPEWGPLFVMLFGN